MKFRVISMLILLVAGLISYQNCGKAGTGQSQNMQSGNGQGYEGKLYAFYYAFDPKGCKTSHGTTIRRALEVRDGKVYLTHDSCASITPTLVSQTDLVYSRYNSKVVSFGTDIFEGFTEPYPGLPRIGGVTSVLQAICRSATSTGSALDVSIYELVDNDTGATTGHSGVVVSTSNGSVTTSPQFSVSIAHVIESGSSVRKYSSGTDQRLDLRISGVTAASSGFFPGTVVYTPGSGQSLSGAVDCHLN